jgi:hypothetical protein
MAVDRIHAPFPLEFVLNRQLCHVRRQRGRHHLANRIDGSRTYEAAFPGGVCFTDTNSNLTCRAEELCPNTHCLRDLNGVNMVSVFDVLTVLGQFRTDFNK